MELLDYNCGRSSVSIHRREECPAYEDTTTTTFDNPIEIFDKPLSKWIQYNPAIANCAFLANIGEDVCWIAQTVKDDIVQVDFHLKDAEEAFLMVRFRIKEEALCN